MAEYYDFLISNDHPGEGGERGRGLKIPAQTQPVKQVNLAEHRQRRSLQAIMLMGGGRGVVEQGGGGAAGSWHAHVVHQGHGIVLVWSHGPT